MVCGTEASPEQQRPAGAQHLRGEQAAANGTTHSLQLLFLSLSFFNSILRKPEALHHPLAFLSCLQHICVTSVNPKGEDCARLTTLGLCVRLQLLARVLRACVFAYGEQASEATRAGEREGKMLLLQDVFFVLFLFCREHNALRRCFASVCSAIHQHS